jgi:UPF0755 protein
VRPPGGVSGVARPAALLLLAAVCLAAAGWGLWLHLPRDSQGAPRDFAVGEGESGGAVLRRLADAGLIGRWEPLLLYARLTGADRRIHPGAYELSPASAPIALLGKLVAGEVRLTRVTIPEGFVAAAVLERLSQSLGIPVADFEAAAADSAWRRGVRLPPGSLEGYLFPETYFFDPAVGPERILAELIGAAWAFFDQERRARAAALGFSPHEVLTLASIIEAETALPEERARISAVYHNRLRRGQLLQADPTVAYGLGRPGRLLLLEDLQAPSPYNTYLHAGLPPGPICSPGRACIDAALWPLESCRDLYFVARGDGSHVFSESLAAHERAKAAVRRQR